MVFRRYIRSFNMPQIVAFYILKSQLLNQNLISGKQGCNSTLLLTPVYRIGFTDLLVDLSEIYFHIQPGLGRKMEDYGTRAIGRRFGD